QRGQLGQWGARGAGGPQHLAGGVVKHLPPVGQTGDVVCPEALDRHEPVQGAGDHLGSVLFFFQAEDGIRGRNVTGVQTCALPIYATTTCLAPRNGSPHEWSCAQTGQQTGLLILDELGKLDLALFRQRSGRPLPVFHDCSCGVSGAVEASLAELCEWRIEKSRSCIFEHRHCVVSYVDKPGAEAPDPLLPDATWF